MPERVIDLSRQTAIHARLLSTRPVQACGDEFVTVFTSECLHDMARQVRERSVLLSLEHLSFLPPLGRLLDASVERCHDGEEELFVMGEGFSTYCGEFDDARLFERLAALPLAKAPTLEVELHYDRRNFDPELALEIETEFVGRARPMERWAELPPIEFALVVPVVWGAARFAGSLLDEVGRATGQALVAKIRSWASKSKDPSRSAVIAVEFVLPNGARVRGVVLLAPSDPDDLLDRALRNVEQLAAMAGLQGEVEILPGMVDCAFFFDGERWRLGWFTDGERVMETVWFREHAPDSASVLGRQPIGRSD